VRREECRLLAEVLGPDFLIVDALEDDEVGLLDGLCPSHGHEVGAQAHADDVDLARLGAESLGAAQEERKNRSDRCRTHGGPQSSRGWCARRGPS